MVRGSDTALRLTFSLKKDAPKEFRQKAENEVASAIRFCGGDVSATAVKLGVSRATLNRWISDSAFLKREVAKARRDGPT